ncbi:hypothetical protein RUM43_002280 [Polyplax serrata]|uniref:Kinesin-like protein costa n=1 Tax=Polyplax serrata TaxID=468196 RepID=A0AAN8P228_POLSC
MDSEFQTFGEDTFGLEFAAVQWLNLVTNAEELFNKLLHSILLSGEEKEQIQRWLCLKQECEECVGSDEATSFDGRQRHSLERIEELTEDTENTQDLTERNGKSSDSQYESDSESDFDYQHPEFDDKVEKYMQCFRDKVDLLIRTKSDRNENLESPAVDDIEIVKRPASFPQQFLPPSAHQKGRRKSLHPGCMSVPIALNELQKSIPKVQEAAENKSIDEKSEGYKDDLLFLENAYSLDTIESNKELKGLTLKLESKKTQVKQMTIDLEDANKRLLELQHTVEIKERLIKELIRNSGTRESAKIKFRKKYTKLEEEYYKIRSQIAHAEHILQEKKHNNDLDFVFRQKNEIEKHKNLAKHYEKRLKDIGMIRQIAGDSAKTVLELENSVLKSKKEIDKIKEHIEKEEAKKEKLEEEILEDGEKIKVLEENIQIPKSDSDIERSDPICPQILDIQTSSTNESSENVEELRKEIVDLRNAKDCLLDQRKRLHDKYRKNRTLSSVEKRRILECDEGIEAIDVAIEYKNEMMCGRTSLDSLCITAQETQGEQMLMDRLLHLSSDEMRTLLHKYFRKVIDLKESGRKMEAQIYELEQENENQGWRIQNLTQTLQTQRIEAEHQKVALQRSHQEKLHLMMRHFADDSGSSSTEARAQMVLAKDDEASKLRRENKHLRRRLQEMEGIMQAATMRKSVLRIRSRSTSPDPQPLKSLPAPPSTSSSCSTSRVTREKNKVIIRLNAPKKKSTNKGLISFTQQK